MTFVAYSVLLCLASVPFCHSLNVCGLEDVPICSLGDTGCLQVMDRALRKWFQTPDAKGYFIEPIDPLVVTEFSFDVELNRYTFFNVSITGLSNSGIEIQPVASLTDIYKHIYTFNIQVTASKYNVRDIHSNKTLNFGLPITLDISNVKTVCNVILEKRRRCDGTDHLFMDPHQVEVYGGQSNIVSRNHTQDNEIRTLQFETVFLETVSRLSTKHLFRDKSILFSIVNYGEVFKDN